MTTHYKIHTITTNATLKVSYRNGTFFRIEKLTGKLSDLQVEKIGVLIPPKEEQIKSFSERLSKKATYTLIETKKTLYSQFNDAWFTFYFEFMGVKPRFNGTDGKHLKQIISYLTELSQNENEAFELWKILLQNWKHLDDFHKQNTDLKYINSRINVILNNVKRINQTGGKTVSSDYLERVMRDLQSD